MAIEIGNLVVELSANVARLKQDVNEAKGIFGRGMSDMQDAARGLQRSLNAIVGSQVLQGIDLLARRGVQAFGVLKRNAIDTADELNKLSQKTGFSVEALSGLKYAAELSDVSLEALAKSLKHLSVNLVEARGGNKELAATFAGLGLATADPQKTLLALAERFAVMPDGAHKAALAVKLFGKEGLAMVPFLNQGRAGIAALTAEAERFGLVMDAAAARQAEEFNDNLTRIEANVRGLVQQLGNSMLPLLLDLSERGSSPRVRGTLSGQ
jgi:hypothetical protein